MTEEDRCIIRHLRLPSSSDHASSDFLARCFACIKRRSECHYSHLADLIELLPQNWTRGRIASDGRLGNHIVPGAPISRRESQDQAVILRQFLPLSTSVTLGFPLRLWIGKDTDPSRHRMTLSTPQNDHLQGHHLGPPRCCSPTFLSPILQLPTSSRPNIPSGTSCDLESGSAVTDMSKQLLDTVWRAQGGDWSSAKQRPGRYVSSSFSPPVVPQVCPLLSALGGESSILS